MEPSREETHKRGEKVEMPTQGSYFETVSTICNRRKRFLIGFHTTQTQVYSCLPVSSYEQISVPPTFHRSLFGFPVSSGEQLV